MAKRMMNWPDSFNAFDFNLGDELIKDFEACVKDSETRAVVLTGMGKAFSSGGDLKTARDFIDYLEGIDAFFNIKASPPLPADKIIIRALTGCDKAPAFLFFSGRRQDRGQPGLNFSLIIKFIGGYLICCGKNFCIWPWSRSYS